jgi:NADH:ubiquinone oxidoreductase subunit 3 (subunit A)
MGIGYDYRLLGGLLVCAILIAPIPLLLPLLIAPRGRGKKTEDTYECGVDTIGTAWTRFAVSFYLFALIFVAFEVDVLYLFPVALVYNDPQFAWRDLIEVAMFLLILSLAILFAWRKGVFRWE